MLRRAWLLVGLWLSQLALIPLGAFISYVLSPLDDQEFSLEVLVVQYILLSWIALLPLWPAAWLALSSQPCLPRLFTAILFMLSLEYTSWPFRLDETRQVHVGDASMFLWLPFLTASMVMCVAALIARWQAVNIRDEPTVSRPRRQFSLRDMFLATAIVAACIPVVLAIVLNWQRESAGFLDKIERYVALMLLLIIVPPAALFMLFTLRLLLVSGWPSRKMIVAWCLSLAVLMAIFAPGDGANVLINVARAFVGITACMFANVVLGGLLLRRLGYRVHSRWNPPPLPTKPPFQKKSLITDYFNKNCK
jgi:hypothetical protein